MKKLTPQAGIILALQIAFLVLLVEQTLNLGLIVLVSGWFWWSGSRGRNGRVVALLILLGAWSVMISQGIFYMGEPRTALLQLVPPEVFPFGDPPGLYLYSEGLRHGLVQSLRFSVMILLGAGLLSRFAVDELTGGMRALRIPGVVCFLFSIALRFLPQMLVEIRALWTAQHFRGFRLFGSGIFSPRETGKALLMPLIVANLRRADEISAALQSRGYSLGEPWLEKPAAMKGHEAMVCWTGAVGIGGLASAHLLTIFHLNGLYSPDWLEWLYHTVQHYV